MDPLKFQCKEGKKGKSCKVKCNKSPKNKDTPKKIFCKNNKWGNKKGKEVYDLSKFGCEPKDDKNKYGQKEPKPTKYTPTTKKTTKYTTKKTTTYTTKKTTKYTTTTKKPYTTKAKYTTKPKYTTTKAKYTTKPKYTTKKPKYTTKYTTKYGSGKKPDPYKPVMECPWDKKGHDGDCGSKYPGKCNLKYFKVCGESFFNKVYNDFCKWQDAKQLIPMITQKLVPLGNRFEKKNGHKCDAKNPYGKTNEELMGGILNDDERDVPQCDAEAGIVPCNMVDFSGVTTAREFHLKIEKLYHDYLVDHCNQEWQVHFDALLIRMRNSLSLMMVLILIMRVTLHLHHHQSTSLMKTSTTNQSQPNTISQRQSQLSTPIKQLPSTKEARKIRKRTRTNTKLLNLFHFEQINIFQN